LFVFCWPPRGADMTQNSEEFNIHRAKTDATELFTEFN